MTMTKGVYLGRYAPGDILMFIIKHRTKIFRENCIENVVSESHKKK